MDVRTFLRRPRIKVTTCAVCRNPKIKKAVDQFVRARERGRTDISFNYFHVRYLLPTFGCPKGVNSLKHHVRSCLGKG